MANKVRLIPRKAINQKLARDGKVQSHLERLANKVGRLAEADLAAHRKTGDHKIKVVRQRNVKYGHIDWYVVMDGTAPVSVEYGHWDRNHNRYVGGLYILTNARFTRI